MEDELRIQKCSKWEISFEERNENGVLKEGFMACWAVR